MRFHTDPPFSRAEVAAILLVVVLAALAGYNYAKLMQPY